MFEDSHLRQLDIFNPELASYFNVDVIGCGGVGSILIPALIKLGVYNISVYDNDNIEVHNLSNQHFKKSDVGKNKAIAIKEIIKEFENIEINAIPIFINKDSISKLNGHLNNIVIIATDSYESRRLIFNHLKNSGTHIIDCRLGGELIHILYCNTADKNSMSHYEHTLFSDDNSNGLPCTARNIIYNGYYITAIVLEFVKRIILNYSLPDNHIFSFTTNGNKRFMCEGVLK